MGLSFVGCYCVCFGGGPAAEKPHPEVAPFGLFLRYCRGHLQGDQTSYARQRAPEWDLWGGGLFCG